MSIKSIIKSIVYKRQYRKISRLITIKGKHHKIGPSASIVFADGSGKDDIVLDDHTNLYGKLISQSHGKISIGKYCIIGRNSSIQCVDSISIADSVILSTNVTICDSNNHPLSVGFRKVRSILYNTTKEMHLYKFTPHKPIVIKENVWLCENVRVCKGVTIGKNCVIGANAIVTKDIPDNCIAVGNPAKVVKTDIDTIPEPTDCKDYNDFISKYGSDF